jgi:hypothetical protein
LGEEEANIVTVALRPGMVDTSVGCSHSFPLFSSDICHRCKRC